MRGDPDFMGKPAPAGYVAGLGRGATGFTTRSDIGPAREDIDPLMENTLEDEEDKDKDNDDAGLFATLSYTEEDAEADQIYNAIDSKMDERRKKRREANERESLLKYRATKPKIQQQFADLKRQLAVVSEDDWGDHRAKRMKKQKDNERFMPVPDSVIIGGAVEMTNTDQSGGTETPMADFTQIGIAREKMLGFKLDQASDTAKGTQSVDPNGYLTELKSVDVKDDAEIGDINKARLLYKNLLATNPKHAPGWISAARLEEVAGKLGLARNIIAKGCEECPTAEDIWLEASRLFKGEEAKAVLANAIRNCSQSEKIWIQCSKLETDVKAQKKILRRALEFIPDSIRLWKAAIELEADEEDAKIMLSGAVECIPYSVELWLALAALETYENARKVLNKARKSIPSSHEIWIAAAKLEEANSNEKMVDVIIQRAITTLNQAGTSMDRDKWLHEAEEAEKAGSVLTCQAIVRATIGMGVDEEDQEATWVDDAENFASKGSVHTARAIYAHAIQTFPQNVEIWKEAAFLEKKLGNSEELDRILENAIKYIPTAEIFWLMRAKEKWLSGELEESRRILNGAFIANPNSEEIWLAAYKLENENEEYARAKEILQNARERCSTERVWMKSAVFERQQGNLEECVNLLKKGIEQFPKFDKLWMIYVQVEQLGGRKVRDIFDQAVKKCPQSVTLWRMYARNEESNGQLTVARSILDRAKILNPKNELLWLESVRLEVRGDNLSIAKTQMAKALQECPNSGILWAEAIWLEPRQGRKGKSVDAHKNAEGNPYVLHSVARLFASERKIDKARSWFSKAIKANPDIGDFWCTLYQFEILYGTEELQESVLKGIDTHDPHHGELWQSYLKNDKYRKLKPSEILKIIVKENETL